MKPAFVVLALSLLLGIQPVTTDLYLPALPAITAALSAEMAQAQLTLSALLLAFGCSQLIWGPVSDRVGRKPVLLVGLLAYVVASLAGALAPSMEALVLARIVQGAAMGASVMCARALVRDLYTPEVGARVISKGLSGLGLIACLSLPLGGVIAEFFGWRAALAALAVFGALALGVVVWRFEETLTQPDRDALKPGRLWRTWVEVLSNRSFRAYALLVMMTYGGLFTFLAASSFVFIGLMGVSQMMYGVLMFTMALAYLIGTFVCRRLLQRVGLHRTVAIGGALTLVGATLVGVLALLGVHGVAPIMMPFYLFMIAHGIHQPCGQAGAVGPFPRTAGAASAMSGFLMMLSAFAMGQWLGRNMDGTVFPLTHGIWFWGTLTALVAWRLVWPLRERQR